MCAPCFLPTPASHQTMRGAHSVCPLFSSYPCQSSENGGGTTNKRLASQVDGHHEELREEQKRTKRYKKNAVDATCKGMKFCRKVNFSIFSYLLCNFGFAVIAITSFH